MAYYTWFTEHDDGKFLLLNGSGTEPGRAYYWSGECCCHPCDGAETVTDSSCACYGVGSVDEPLILEITTTCGDCSASRHLYMCYVDACTWQGGFNEYVNAGECVFILTQTVVDPGDDYWVLKIWGYDGYPGNGQLMYEGTYEGDWDCTGSITFDGSGMTEQYYVCHDATASVSAFSWAIPS
jgi:hypothetical protein